MKGMRRFKCLPKTDETFISFDIGCLKFIDSMRFLNSSLDSLSSSLPKEKNILRGLMEEDPLITKKLAYPYEYFQSLEDYDKPLQLTKEDYFSQLNQ
jgi:hypothetical protein